MIEAEAVLVLNPVRNYLSGEVYCCFIRKLGLAPGTDLLEYLNKNYGLFVDAVNLVSMGQIEELDTLLTKANKRTLISFQTLSKARENLKNCAAYYYDMSGKKYEWVKL